MNSTEAKQDRMEINQSPLLPQLFHSIKSYTLQLFQTPWFAKNHFLVPTDCLGTHVAHTEAPAYQTSSKSSHLESSLRFAPRGCMLRTLTGALIVGTSMWPKIKSFIAIGLLSHL